MVISTESGVMSKEMICEHIMSLAKRFKTEREEINVQKQKSSKSMGQVLTINHQFYDRLKKTSLLNNTESHRLSVLGSLLWYLMCSRSFVPILLVCMRRRTLRRLLRRKVSIVLVMMVSSLWPRIGMGLTVLGPVTITTTWVTLVNPFWACRSCSIVEAPLASIAK